jgi:hypothetical protein
LGTPDVTIERACLEDALELADVMREADVAECEAIGGHPLDHLIASLDASAVAYTVRFDGEVAAMYGAGPADDTTLCSRGVAWLLTGRRVAQHPKAFLKLCRPAVAELLGLYPVLENAIDARYAAAVRWAKWLGFVVEPAVKLGPAGALFHHVRLEAPYG